ncbi:MAG: DUF3737 family protein [Muribaculum sp.]|nr:DUF3737 family protein [Muribaculaceae bacterium]MCM1080542.1 DUF3737 family protein [Muribaculum sp.]
MEANKNFVKEFEVKIEKTVEGKEFGGERALFATHGLKLENVTFHPGESALKCCTDISALNCRFEGKYPFWHVDRFVIDNCEFTVGARAALWYSKNLVMTNTQVDAPKMFREMQNLTLENVKIPDAQETLWGCKGIELRNVEITNADYVFFHCSDIDIEDYHQEGNYSFQYCKNVTIRNAVLNSKDAFWETDGVTIYDSEINGEYLGWHSKNLKLVRCKINGTQPLCYCENLIMENCTMGDECDLSFEDSDLHATVDSAIVSVKNPRTGSLKALSIGETIIDKNVLAPNDCAIVTEI